MKQPIEYIIGQISDLLLINGGFLDHPGLYTGEMGVALFFTRYARYTRNDLYLDYSYDLMEKAQNNIHWDTSINYKHGLTGVGSAIEYLVQNRFIEADTDDVLEEFDNRIFFTYNLPYLPVEEIMDIGYYAGWRMSGNSSKKDMIRQNILSQIENALIERSVNPICLQINRTSTPIGFENKTFAHCQALIANNEFWNKNIWLYDGLAGWGLSLLTELDGDDTWFPLIPNGRTHRFAPTNP